jgi:hypothetical protein
MRNATEVVVYGSDAIVIAAVDPLIDVERTSIELLGPRETTDVLVEHAEFIADVRHQGGVASKLLLGSAEGEYKQQAGATIFAPIPPRVSEEYLAMQARSDPLGPTRCIQDISPDALLVDMLHI